MVMQHGTTEQFKQECLAIWRVLTVDRHQGRTMNYRQVSDILDMDWRIITQGHHLDAIYWYCNYHNLPSLASLVVRRDTGLPGDGYIGVDAQGDMEIARNYDWGQARAPTREDL